MASDEWKLGCQGDGIGRKDKGRVGAGGEWMGDANWCMYPTVARAQVVKVRALELQFTGRAQRSDAHS